MQKNKSILQVCCLQKLYSKKSYVLNLKIKLKYVCQNRVKQPPKAPGTSPQSTESQNSPDPKYVWVGGAHGSWAAPTTFFGGFSGRFVLIRPVSRFTSNICRFLTRTLSYIQIWLFILLKWSKIGKIHYK